MATVVNDRSVRLQAESPRFFAPGDRALLLGATANIVKSSGATLSPTSVTFVANLLNMTGTVTYTTAPTTPLTISGNTATLASSDLTGNSVTVTATFTKDGVTYTSAQTVVKVADGASGARGAGTYYATGSVWSDSTADAACPGGKVVGDTVVISDNGTFALTKTWTGTAWMAPGLVIDGTLLVTGSVKSAAIDTTNLTIRDSVGNVIFGAGVKIDWVSWVANKPTTLAALDAAAGLKLNGIAAGATVGATIGSNLYGLLDSSNISTYIAAAAIGDALIGNLSAGKVTAGTLSGLSLNIASSVSGVSLLSAGYGGSTVGYCRMSGYNFSCSNSGGGGNPSAATIDASSFGGSAPAISGSNGSGTGTGYVGYGSYSFYSAGGTAGPFTGSHDALLANGTTFEVGDIVVDLRCVARKDVSNTLFEVALASAPRQAAVLGVLAADAGPLSENKPTTLVQQYLPALEIHDDFGDLVHVDQTEYAPEYAALKDAYRLVLVNALGEGQINVCGENGDIAAGDFICTSSTPGKGMRQDETQKHNFTVARAREAAVFGSPGEARMIACIYESG
jgi:hypothetical protein